MPAKINSSKIVKNAKLNVMLKTNKSTNKHTRIIGVKTPETMVLTGFLTSTWSHNFENLGASHNPNNQITVTVISSAIALNK